jgi:hypothetical protein
MVMQVDRGNPNYVFLVVENSGVEATFLQLARQWQ